MISRNQDLGSTQWGNKSRATTTANAPWPLVSSWDFDSVITFFSHTDTEKTILRSLLMLLTREYTQRRVLVSECLCMGCRV